MADNWDTALQFALKETEGVGFVSEIYLKDDVVELDRTGIWIILLVRLVNGCLIRGFRQTLSDAVKKPFYLTGYDMLNPSFYLPSSSQEGASLIADVIYRWNALVFLQQFI